MLMLEVTVYVGLAVLTVFGLLYVAAQLSARRWSDEEFERERHSGTAVGNAFLVAQAFFDPSAKHALEQRGALEVEDVASGDPPASGPHHDPR